MDWPEVKLELVDSVRPVLEPLGYGFVKAQHSFERTAGHEIRLVFLIFVAKTRHMMVWCGIKNREIEAVFHRTSGIDEKYRRNYTVVNVSMDEYLSLDGRTDIEEAKHKTCHFLQEEVVPFLERHYTVTDYSHMLNADPAAPRCKYHGNRENRCHYGLICAKISGDPCYEAVKEAYSTFLRTTAKGFYYPRFQALVADLEGNVEELRSPPF